MDDRWRWAEEIWTRSFAPVERLGLTLQRVDQAAYWKIHEAEMRHHFPPEVFFDMAGLRSEAEKSGIERLDATSGAAPLKDFCVARDGDALAATFCGHQHLRGSYRMWHTHVHPDYRRRGIYRAILAATIAYTGELGFDSIVSDHAPGNNPVLIAKLGAGFRVTGLEVDPMVGLSVNLTYFHNPDHLAVYEFRCGLATINDRIIARGAGAMELLRKQLGGEE